jgi:hypothetical protein
MQQTSHFCFHIRVFPSFLYYFAGVTPPPPSRISEEEKDIDRDFSEFAIARGYQVEEHFVKTQDGYILTIHRILPRFYHNNNNDNNDNTNGNTTPRGHGNNSNANGHSPHTGRTRKEQDTPTSEPPISPRKKKKAHRPVPSKGVVFFQHGMMMNSEVWIARRHNHSLPFLLSDLG